MPPLSVAIICRNNERTLPAVLASVAELGKLVETETLAVDSGSTDSTLSLLEARGARVIRTDWRGYVGTKQLALESCSGDWILSLDSDEPPEPALRTAIADVVRPGSKAPAVAYRVNRKVWYRGKFLDHAWQPEWRLRLVKRGCAAWGGIDPHDKLDVLPGKGSVADLPRDAVLRHDCMDSAAAFLARQVSHSRLFAEGIYAAGQRTSPLKVATSPAGAFLKQIILKGAWKDGWRGFVAAGCHAAAALMKHAILLELQNSRGDDR
jgi:hypothetical protein